jgi:hypothetical protein
MFIPLLIWTYILLGRGGFWRVKQALRLGAPLLIAKNRGSGDHAGTQRSGGDWHLDRVAAESGFRTSARGDRGE